MPALRPSEYVVLLPMTVSRRRTNAGYQVEGLVPG